MAKGKVHCYQETGEIRQVEPGDVFIDLDGSVRVWSAANLSQTKYPIVVRISEDRITVVDPPERFYRVEGVLIRDRENPGWKAQAGFYDDAARIVSVMNTLDRAAKEKSNAE